MVGRPGTARGSRTISTLLGYGHIDSLTRPGARPPQPTQTVRPMPPNHSAPAATNKLLVVRRRAGGVAPACGGG